jgi:diketogulonate reductase-like aldo/keto reductase
MDADTRIDLRGGSRMPVLGLGTWQLTRDTAQTIATAIELGYRLIDTSGDYGTQPGIARGIRDSGVDRSELYVTTKVEETEDAYDATRKNLGELRLDYADLMLVHRPPDSGAGEELWRGLIRAQKEGLATDIGVSNYSIELIEALIETTGEIPAVNQVEWSPFGHSDELLEYARRRRIVLQAYSPVTRTERLADPRLTSIAAGYRKTPAQVLLRWNLQRGTVPLPKANQRQHLKENLDLFDFELNDGDLDTLNALNEHYSSLGSLPYV